MKQDMQLIMENWNRFQLEEQLRQEIMKYLSENNIVLSEQQLNEEMPKWLKLGMKKLGKGASLAALAAMLAGSVVAPTPAHAGTSYQGGAETHQVDASKVETGYQKSGDMHTYKMKGEPDDTVANELTAKAMLVDALVQNGVIEKGAELSGIIVNSYRDGTVVASVSQASVETAAKAGGGQSKTQTQQQQQSGTSQRQRSQSDW